MIKWRARSGWNEITPVECLRETDNFVFVGKHPGQRRAKCSDGESYFGTWDEAHTYLLSYAQDRVKGSANALKIAERKFDDVLALKKPEGAQ